MSRKYNVRHTERGRSHYPARLLKRGLSKAPVMASLETLRNKQNRRIREYGQPWPLAHEDAEGQVA